jgi:hypothetical protein
VAGVENNLVIEDSSENKDQVLALGGHSLTLYLVMGFGK